MAFSPDGHTLASGSIDDTVRLWNLTDPAHPGPLGQPLHGHTDPVQSVAFSPDGHTLASGSEDATVRLWPTPLDATVATLCSKLTSNISHHDWHDWISPTIGYDHPVPQPARPTELNHVGLPRDSENTPFRMSTLGDPVTLQAPDIPYPRLTGPPDPGRQTQMTSMAWRKPRPHKDGRHRAMRGSHQKRALAPSCGLRLRS